MSFGVTVAPYLVTSTFYVGQVFDDFGIHDGSKFNGDLVKQVKYGEKFKEGMIIEAEVDRTLGTLSFSFDGKDAGVAFVD